MAKSGVVRQGSWATKFNALRNAQYHMARQAWFEIWSRISNLLIILLGTALATQLTRDFYWMGTVFAVVTALVGSLQLVFDFGGAARTHEFLKRKYFEVASDCDRHSKNAKSLELLNERLAALHAEEPPTYRAVDATAYNQVVDAFYASGGDSLKCSVSRWQRITQHILHHSSSDFRTKVPPTFQ